MNKKQVILIMTVLAATALWGCPEDDTSPYAQYIRELALDHFDSPPSAKVFLERQALNELIIADIYARRSLHTALKKNPDASIRASIAYILGEIRSLDSYHRLDSLLSDKKENVLTRISALAALEKINKKSLRDGFWKHLFKDEAHQRFYQVVSSPPRLSPDGIKRRTEIVIDRLTWIGAGTVTLAGVALDSLDGYTNPRAIQILSSIGKPAITGLIPRYGVPKIEEFRFLGHELAKNNVLLALLNMDRALLLENREVEVIFTQASYDPWMSTRILGVTGLSKLGGEMAKAHLKWVSLYDESKFVKEHARKALTMEYETFWKEMPTVCLLVIREDLTRELLEFIETSQSKEEEPKDSSK